MAVAVVIPTCNRPGPVKSMLQSILDGSMVPEELMVVDQSKGPETENLVGDLRRRYPFLKYERDTGTGTSHAKNLGWSRVSSELVCFTDDDAEVDHYWLESLVTVLDANADCGAAGGRIDIPNLDDYRPLVFPKDKMYLMPYLNFGEQTKMFHDGSYPVGVNMITRRDLLSKLGGFNEDLGPNYAKRRPISGEESDYCHRVHLLGFSLIYVGNAIVRHPFTRERNTLAFVKKRLKMELYTQAVFDLNCEPFYKYFYKAIYPVMRIVAHKLKGRNDSQLDKYLLWEEFKSYLVALFRAPRSIRRSRKNLKTLLQ
ncbi:MAG TPA: glycosyltransferase [Spirochaetia bacterium]|nr:glycosyltransferase [Spirochaetia bacterium]